MPGVTLSVNRTTYTPEEPISVLVIPDRDAEEISGTLQIARVPETEEGRPQVREERPVAYRGPPIQFISSTFSAPPESGAYLVTFAGSHETSPRTAATFFVSTVTGRSQPRTVRPRGDAPSTSPSRR